MRVLVAFSKFSLILHSRSWPCRSSVAIRALSSESSPSQSRGFLPRFHSQILPTSKDEVIRVQGDEFWHMTRVLRLGVNDRVELFDGMGGLVEGCIKSIDHNGSDIIVLEDPTILSPQSIQWHVFAAFGSLKGGRADWLVEKCTIENNHALLKELGASSVTPLLTERSPTIAENRMDRFQRVILAAVKQCQRLHEMALRPPMKLHNFISVVSQSKASFLAAAEAIPILNVLSSSSAGTSGLLIVGPEGDFTEQELKLMTDAGATLVGLGPSRLRVETATVALLSTVMLWSETVISGTFYQQ